VLRGVDVSLPFLESTPIPSSSDHVLAVLAMAVTMNPRRLASLSFAFLSVAAAHLALLPRDDPLPHEILDFSSSFGVRQPSVNGTPPLIAFQSPPPELLKRDCLANGSNFCFSTDDDDLRFCSGCGTCCSQVQTLWCCSAGSVCCGSSCCGTGQTCTNGICYLPR